MAEAEAEAAGVAVVVAACAPLGKVVRRRWLSKLSQVAVLGVAGDGARRRR